MTISHCGVGRRGFTLAEAMMATVVLGIAAAGVLLPFSKGTAVRAEGMRRTLGAKLAGDLMEEIVTKPFHDPDGETTEDFDDIDDFDGYVESEGQIKDAGGVVFTDLNYMKFSRDSICDEVFVPQQIDLDVPKYIRITVRVYYDGKEIAVINRLVSE